MIESQAFLTRAAGAAEFRMRDTCRVTQLPSGDVPIDPDTGLPPESASTLVYEGPCRLRMSGQVAGSTSRDVAGDRVSTSAPMLSVPVAAVRLGVGHLVLITGVPSDDPAGHLRLGLRLRVTGLVLGTDMTAQRVTVETVTG